jgi:hypothetical protein
VVIDQVSQTQDRIEFSEQLCFARTVLGAFNVCWQLPRLFVRNNELPAMDKQFYPQFYLGRLSFKLALLLHERTVDGYTIHFRLMDQLHRQGFGTPYPRHLEHARVPRDTLAVCLYYRDEFDGWIVPDPFSSFIKSLQKELKKWKTGT